MASNVTCVLALLLRYCRMEGMDRTSNHHRATNPHVAVAVADSPSPVYGDAVFFFRKRRNVSPNWASPLNPEIAGQP